MEPKTYKHKPMKITNVTKLRDFNIDIQYDVYTKQKPYNRFVGRYLCRCVAEDVMEVLKNEGMQPYMKKAITKKEY